MMDIVTTTDFVKHLEANSLDRVRLLFTLKSNPNMGVIIKLSGSMTSEGEDQVALVKMEKLYIRSSSPIASDTPREDIQPIVKATDLPEPLMMLYLRIHDRFVSWQNGMSIFSTFQMEDVNYSLLGDS